MLTASQVCVADGETHCVQVFTREGVFLRKWGSQGSKAGLFNLPYELAVRGNHILVNDHGNHSLSVFHPDGTFVDAWSTCDYGEGDFHDPGGLAVMRAGQVLIGDCRNWRIHVFE